MSSILRSYLRALQGRQPQQALRQRRAPLTLEALEARDVPAANLVAAYSFDEGSGAQAADVSGNGNTGSVSNATWTTSGKYNGALSFNGTNSWVTVNSSASLQLSKGMTLEAWANPSSISGRQSVLMKERSSGFSYSLFATNPGGSVSAPTGMVNAGKKDVVAEGTSNLPLNTWSFLTATFDGTTLRTYVNGKLVASKAASGSIMTNQGALRIGGNAVWGDYFKGMIDNVRIYDAALSQSEIQTDMGSAVGGTPVANAGPSRSGAEGSAVTFAGSASGGQGSLSYAWDFGDGTRTTGTLTPSHVYADNGNYTATLTVTDSLGQVNRSSTAAAVSNVNPTTTIIGPSWSVAGSSVTFTASATDPGSADTAAGFGYAWDFGDGTTGSGASLSHTFTAPGTYTVKATATDKDGGQGPTTQTIQVYVKPAATFGNSGPVGEGSTANVSFSGLSGGSGNYLYSYDFNNDGTFEVSGSSSVTVTVPASYLADGPFTRVVHGRISDTLTGLWTDFTTSITVTNVAPTPQISGPSSGSVGASLAFSASATDPSSADTNAGFTFAWDFGDGTTGSGASVSHSYAAAGTYTIKLTATDKDGGSSSVTTTFQSGGDLTDKLVSYWKMDEASGNALDAYGSYDLTDNNTVASGSGKIGTARDFERDNAEYFTHTDTADLSTGDIDFTLSAWVYLESKAGTMTIVAKEGAGDYEFFLLYRASDDRFQFEVWTPGQAYTRVNADNLGSPSTGTWYHVIAWHDSVNNEVGITVNNGAPNTASHSGGLRDSSGLWYIGGNQFSENFDGLIDEVGYWKRVLTSQDRSDLSNGGAGRGPFDGKPVARFGNSGPVGENSTATVSFSGPSGGSGNYLYSYDFDNDGTFDVSGSATASATVAASYLADGPMTRVVRGRISDTLTGLWTDHTTSITVTNVAPTPQISGPGAGNVGASLAFSASATDPSSADTNAGFAFAWDFGDGTTGSGASVSHAFSAAGTYTLKLTAKDKDGDQATASFTVTVSSQQQGDFIQTGDGLIPNFGAHPTVVANRSGAWSSPSTWSTGLVPGAGDIVSIAAGTTVTYDVVSDAVVDTVAIQAGGSLVFRTDVNTRLTVINLLVMPSGTLTVGTVASPVLASVKAEVIFANVPFDNARDPSQWGHGLIGLGKVNMYGAVSSDSFVRLAVAPRAGDTTLTLATPVSGWQVGNKVIVPDTHQLDWWEQHTYPQYYTPQMELMTIAAISGDGRTITLSAPLQYNHLGSTTPDGQTEFLPHVGLLSHNVVVRSQSATGVRGQVTFLDRADVDIRYVQFSGLGRTTNAAIDNTTYDVYGNVTHIGSNQNGRFPVSFDHVYGPTSTPANGYQFTFVGNSDFCPISPMTFIWGLAVNDSHYGLVKDNVFYNWAGSGVATLSGNETGNVFDHNFVVRVNGDGARANDGLDGTGFWFRGPNNVVLNNVATDIRGDHSPYAYGFLYSPPPGVVRVPAYQGADPTQNGQYTQVDTNAIPLAEFSGNEVYGATYNGMSVWWLGARNDDPVGTAGTIKNLRVWNVYGWGIYVYQTANLTIDGFVARGNTQLSPENWAGYGIFCSDYRETNLQIVNANIQGFRVGIQAPHNAAGQTIIKDSYLRNQTDITVETPWTVAGGQGIQPHTTIIDNVRFDPIPGRVLQAIALFYSDGDSHNVVALDRILVYNYNGTPGDNFQVYYTQQAANYIVPKTGETSSNPDRPVIGAPVSGLTNRQLWDRYGMAIAGAVAPDDATTRAGIVNALVRAF